MLKVKNYTEILRQRFQGQPVNHEVFQVPQYNILVIDWDNPPFREDWDDMLEWILDNEVLMMLATDKKYNIGELIVDNEFLSFVYKTLPDSLLINDVTNEPMCLTIFPQAEGIFRISEISEIGNENEY